MMAAAFQFLPQTKYQLIGFVFYLLTHLLSDYFVGKSTRIKGSGILDAAIIAITGLWKAVRGK